MEKSRGSPENEPSTSKEVEEENESDSEAEVWMIDIKESSLGQ